MVGYEITAAVLKFSTNTYSASHRALLGNLRSPTCGSTISCGLHSRSVSDSFEVPMSDQLGLNIGKA